MNILSWLNVSNISNLEADSGYVFQKLLMEEILSQKYDWNFYFISPCRLDSLDERIKKIELDYGYNKYEARFNFPWNELKEKIKPIISEIDLIYVNQSELTTNFRALEASLSPQRKIPIVTYYHYLPIEPSHFHFSKESRYPDYDKMVNLGETKFPCSLRLDQTLNNHDLALPIFLRQVEAIYVSDYNVICSNFGLDLFLNNLKSNTNKHKHTYVAFYGGEALVNKRVLNKTIEYVHERMAKEGLSDKTTLCLQTNGTLVDKRQADFLSEYGVNVTISFDGLSHHHDLMRVFPNGKGSFRRTLKGYEKLRDKCNTIILCTIGNHNINDLEEIADYFAEELKPTAVEFSLVRNLNYGSGPAKIKSLDDAFEKLYSAHKILIKKGIPDNNFSRTILSLANGYVHSYHYTRCGDVLYVSPNGRLYTCDSFLGMGLKTNISVTSSLTEIKNDDSVNEWFKRHPFNMKACKGCVVISSCGGGCPYNAKITSGSLYNQDEQNCKLSNFVFNKLIEELKNMKAGDLNG